MKNDRVPTPAEYEQATSQAGGQKIMGFFRRARRFPAKPGIGDSKEIQPQRLTWPPQAKEVDPPAVTPEPEQPMLSPPPPAAPSDLNRVRSPRITPGEAPASLERAPAPRLKLPAVPAPFERAPAPRLPLPPAVPAAQKVARATQSAAKPPGRRPIKISPQVRAQRGGVSSAATEESRETDWSPSWPSGLSESEIRKRIRTQNYMEPD